MEKLTRKLQAVWEKKLRKAGMSMDAGRDPRHTTGAKNRLIYVGSSGDVDALNEQLVGKRAGRVKPKGHGPDKFEADD
jgi:hypothetical protein